MALDRQSIEKRDFPIGRRGYDPEAVDAHLAEVANEVDELKLSASRHTEPLASSASEQVRAIIEAAVASAAEILRQSENDAREIRAEAAQEAQAARAELSSLIDGLRTGANRLNEDLQLLEGNLDGVRDSLGARAQFENQPSPADVGVSGVGGGSQLSDGAGAPVADGGAETDPEPEVAADIDGARLVALNMALNGTPRDETERYLSENFQLDDRMTLLDEVYSSVQG
jgi:DivIVA domain-containing protein